MIMKFSRLIAVAMAAVVCFVLIVPMALRQNNPGLALVISLIFVMYAGANVMLWLRYRR
jgi:hypothetical protein